MFNGYWYKLKKEHINDLVRETEHHMLVRSIQRAQPRSHTPLMTFLAKLWQRRPAFNSRRRLGEHESSQIPAPNRLA
jgi:hypothetical protein